jgi:excisionase family DNA binding protein
MPDPSLLSVDEAAERLGVSPAAVRQQISAGRLRAVKRARSWWLDERAVQRSARIRARPGRPLSPEMAWAIILLASGHADNADRLAGRERYLSRMRAWLQSHPLSEQAAQLRMRASGEDFACHPAELKRLVERSDVLATGISAGDVIGLIGKASGVEAYAPAGHRDAITKEHALALAADGPVRLHWVPDELWPRLQSHGERRAPRAAILLDLLESDDPRARREAARALA